MSWMQKLCEAYDVAIGADMTGGEPLVPVGFIKKKVQYSIRLSARGEFISAEPYSDDFSLIPTTPQAEGRTGDNGTPFPLAEQLKYLVPSDKYNHLADYLAQLSSWCSFEGAPWQLGVVKTYLESGTILSDLMEKAHVPIKYHKDIEKKDEDGPDTKTFITFRVESGLNEQNDLLLRKDIQESWRCYNTATLSGATQMCYISGQVLPLVENHPKVQGNAKLISAKDNDFPFQYRGRFTEDRSAVFVSYDASIRAHNALKWLMERQGLYKYGMWLVVWNTNGCQAKLGQFDDHPLEDEDEEDTERMPVDTYRGYAKMVTDAVNGVWNNYPGDEKRMNETVFLGLEAATDGRMSVTYEQEIPGNLLVERLKKWYSDCCWIMYRKSRNGFTLTTPTPREICEAVLGVDCVKRADKDKKCEKSDAKVNRELRTRILDCMINARPLPEALIRSAFNRSVNPLTFTKDETWDRKGWEKGVAVTCALIFKHLRQTEDVLLFEPLCRERDYLYGRLLAVADKIGTDADNDHKNTVPNHAIRAMHRLAQRPFETWTELYLSLLPTLCGLETGTALWYQKIIGGIERLFKPEERADRRALSYRFLQGYACQMREFYRKKDEVCPAEPQMEQQDRKDGRNELYGALLAVADVMELQDRQDSVETNALRMMKVFTTRPKEAWARLHDRLIPYMEKSDDKGGYFAHVMEQIEAQFTAEDIDSPAPLDGRFLNGYFRVRQALQNGEKLTYVVEKSAFDLPQTRSAAYGRLLGLEDRIERCAMDIEKRADEKRLSNAFRFMSRMSGKPETTWRYLRQRVEPYRNKLAYRRVSLIVGWMGELEKTEHLIRERNWNTDEPLDSSYIHEFYRTHTRKHERI